MVCVENIYVGKLLNGIKSMYVDSSACVIVEVGESERFRIYSGVRQGYNVYMDREMKEVKMGMEKRGMRFMEDGI